MIFNIPREYTQAFSTVLMSTGVASMVVAGMFPMGVALVAGACWVMLISESLLLSKVQSEMGQALESLRKKQEIEVKDLLFFLRQSELGNSPWSNIEAAKNHIQKIGFPAIITDSGGACVAINPPMYDALGYGKDFIGELCHGVTRTDIYGEYIQGISMNITEGKRFMHSRLVMIDVDGKEHVGTVSITMLPDMRTAVGIWYPDADGILRHTNEK
jgi:hypothetical protein